MTGARARRPRAPRDQAESPFAVILEDLIALVPFARGAAIVDFEGETVDYAGDLDPFELRIAAATLQLTLADVRECRLHGSVVQLNLCLGKSGYLLRVLDPSYSLLMVMRKLGTFAVSSRVLLEIETRILVEAHLPIVRRQTSFRIDVETTGRGARLRPARIRPVDVDRARDAPFDWMPVEVLGAVVAVSPGERAFRVRLATGAEVTLVRDGARHWFAEERLEALMREGKADLAHQP